MKTARGWLGLLMLVWVATAQGAPKLKPGDMATVKVDGAEIRQGQKVLAKLKKGDQIKIHYVQGGFARVWFKLGGKGLVGYMSVRELEPPERKNAKAVENPFVVDDEVVVLVKEAKLKKGKETLGTVAKGTRLMVKKVNGKWLGVYADVQGKRTFGWIHSRDVDHVPFVEKSPPPKKNEESK